MAFKFLYSRVDAAKLLSISVREVDRLISNGTLQIRRHGRRRLVLSDSLIRFARGVDQGYGGGAARGDT
jgi:excisionase family DNA binding protein